jgi:serine/threonine-protein kinase
VGAPGSTLSYEPAGEVATQLAPGDRVDAVYRVERLLGTGGAGAVYLVRHEGLEPARFALKVLHPSPGRSADLLAREGRLAAGVRSAHVVKVTALGQLPGGAPYLVTEFVEGTTLEDRLAASPLPRAAALECGRQLCLALEAVHAAGLVHGDVSLRNVFVTPQTDGRLHLQLGDFGLARRVRRDAGGTISLELGGGRGTPRFMSPEAVSGDALDERSDLFSAGVILYRLFAGVFPFEGAAAREILAAILRGAPVPLGRHGALPPALESVVMACLAGAPDQRPASAAAVREVLERVPPKSLLGAPRRRGLARRWGLRVAVALVATAVAERALDAWRTHAAIPMDAPLSCPPTRLDGPLDSAVGPAVARAMCARVGAALDVDWGGGPGAIPIETRLVPEPDGAFRLDVSSRGRRVSVRAATPRAAALEGARALLARAAAPPLSAEEIARWGAGDERSAAGVRRLFRERSALVYEDLVGAARALLASDPELPLAHLMVADIERDPALQAAARAAALEHAARLPPNRASAVRGYVELLAGVDAGATAGPLETLRRAYGAEPGDLDVALLYVGALGAAGHRETAMAVARTLHDRFPRRAALAAHHGSTAPDLRADDSAPFVDALIADLPDQAAATANICLLVGTGRLDAAAAALDFARAFGMPASALPIPAAVLAFAQGDPEAIDRATSTHAGSSLSWSAQTGSRMRLAALLTTGRLAEAGSLASELFEARRTSGDRTSALLFGAERLRITRWTGGPPLGDAPARALEALSRADDLPLVPRVTAATELALSRLRAPSEPGGPLPQDSARATLAALEGEIHRRAAGDTQLHLGATLRALPLVREVLGPAEAAARWRAASGAYLSDRVRAAYEAGLALEALGAGGEAIEAYRLAASPYDVDRHPWEYVAARLRWATLADTGGDPQTAGALRAFAARAWSRADDGLLAHALSTPTVPATP